MHSANLPPTGQPDLGTMVIDGLLIELGCPPRPLHRYPGANHISFSPNSRYTFPVSTASANYILGHTDHERRRLTLQAEVLNPLTKDFLKRAGLAVGMRVLDMGCGVGDVSMLAARLVGPTGRVTGVDLDPGALAISKARTDEAELTNLSFVQANLMDYSAPEPYDAVVGRHILIHAPDAFAVLRRAIVHVRPGGLVAFQEYDLSRYYPHFPAKPLYERISKMFVDFFTRVTHADIGMRLFQMFHDAELANIHSRAEFIVDGGPQCPFYEWTTETVRSLLPKLEALGVVTAKELDLDTLTDRLRQESITMGGYISGPIMVGTFGQKV